MKAHYSRKLKTILTILVIAASVLFLIYIYNSSRYTTYKDTAAHFTVTYPRKWGTKQRPIQNELQQGAVLYKPDSKTEIGIYRSSEAWSLSVQDSIVERDSLILDNGHEASILLVKNDDTIQYTALIQPDLQYYVIYVRSSKDFYLINEGHIRQMVKSFRIY